MPVIAILKTGKKATLAARYGSTKDEVAKSLTEKGMTGSAAFLAGVLIEDDRGHLFPAAEILTLLDKDES